MNKQTTGERLKKIMSLQNLKQIDILRKCEPYSKKYGVIIRKNDLSQYVSGKVQPKQDKLSILGMALNVNEAWLMGYDVPMTRDIKVVKNDKKADIVLTDNIFIEIMTPNSFQKLSELNKDDRTKVEEYIDFLHSKKQY